MTMLTDDVRRWVPPDQERVSINIHPDVHDRLRRLLFMPEMRAIGYSAFINRACEVAENEILVQRRAEREG